MYKRNAICNAEDRVGYHGNWCKSYEKGDTIYFTRSGMLWGGMLSRIKHQPYVVTGHTFEDFNDFSEFVQGEVGYRARYKDKYFSMDKDLLVPWNTTYSKDTISFIPQAINSLFLKPVKNPLNLAYGVSWQEQRGKFASYITVENRRTFLGRYDTAEEAHKAWQAAKIQKIYEVREKFKNDVAQKVLDALSYRVAKLEEEYKNGEITIL